MGPVSDNQCGRHITREWPWPRKMRLLNCGSFKFERIDLAPKFRFKPKMALESVISRPNLDPFTLTTLLTSALRTFFRNTLF